MPASGTTIGIDCLRTATPVQPSSRMGHVALKFGIPLRGAQPHRILQPLRLRLGPGRIVLLLGPSGSGKSTVLQLVASSRVGGNGAICVDRVRLPPNRSVIDAVCPNEPLAGALELLSACGLGETPLWLRSPEDLSDGERFRARLARAVGIHLRARSTAVVLCDEFCSGLHRRVARAIAFNLRKLATRNDLSFVLASSSDDIVTDLQPDTLVRLQGRGAHEIVEQTPRRRPISFRRRLHIELGRKADYHAFGAMHYRATDELGFVDKVFVLREGVAGDLLGIVVFSYGPIELALRNRATANRFLRNPARLNRELRILRRLVIHPDLRGCGLGHWLVARTLPRVGTQYVECLASMGEVNPVFEKAGMTRIGTCTLPPEGQRALDELHRMDIDPFARDFVMHVSRRPAVRRLVAHLVSRWYRATTAEGEGRVARQSPEFLAQTFRGLVGARPVYYLWQRTRTARARRVSKGGVGRC